VNAAASSGGDAGGSGAGSGGGSDNDVAGDGGHANTGHFFTSTGVDSLQFKLGRHACPGCFLTAMELKLLLAHLIMHYDMKMPYGEEKQQQHDMGERNTAAGLDAGAVILLRKRK
jgi:hypothetical protein